MSFTDGQPFVVTEEQLTLPWAGARDGRNFRCSICGAFFQVGQQAVFIYGANGVPNFFSCVGVHDASKDELRAELARLEKKVKELYWWALPHRERPSRPGLKRDSKADREGD